MRKLASLLLSLFLILSLAACGQKAESTWQEQYDLGVRYLSEGNYEEAILAFTAAIEIDPKQLDSYRGLAEVYVAMGDTAAARQTLEDGFAATGDEQLQDLLEAMRDGGAERPAYTGQPGDSVAELRETSDISIDEVCIDGIPIRQLTIEQVQQLRPETESPIFGIRSNSTEYTYGNWSWWNGEKPSTFDVEQRFDSPCLTRVQYDAWLESWDAAIVLDVGFRGLHTCDSLTDVLIALGFTGEGASLLAEDAASRAPDDALCIVLDLPGRDAYLDTAGYGGDVTDYCTVEIILEDWIIWMCFAQGQRMDTFTAVQFDA